MKRDLTFFIFGIVFGTSLGFFLFQAFKEPKGLLVQPPGAQGGLDVVGAAREQLPLDTVLAGQLKEEVEANPDDAQLRNRLGKLYMDSGQHSEALIWFESALVLMPGNLHVRNHLALSLLNMGRTNEAIAQYEEALRIDPTHPQSLLGLGRVKLYVQRDIRGGLTLWERLIREAPASDEARSISEELEALKSAHSG